MIVDVTRTDEAVTPFSFESAAEQFDLDTPNYRLSGPVKAAGELEKHIGRVKVKGTISGTAEIDCTRCLQPVEQPVAISFDVDYLTEGGLGSEGEHEIDPADLEVDELQSNTLDLNQVVREQILLNIPEQFFCKEDCKGLCEQCGENLNLVDCNCGKDDVDPRWAALKSLKDSLN